MDSTSTMQILSDISRTVLILLCLYSTIMSVFTMHVYRRRLALETANYIKSSEKIKTHVHFIAAGSTIASIAWAVDIYFRFGLPLTWRTPVLLIAFSCTSYAQYHMFGAQSSLYKLRTKQIETARMLSLDTDEPN